MEAPDKGVEEVSEEMIAKFEREEKLNAVKKRKLDEQMARKKEAEKVYEPDDYENYGKHK